MKDSTSTQLLIVDEDRSVRNLCIGIGNSLGFACSEAETGEAALQTLNSLLPDIVLLDLELKDLPGEVLLRQFKNLAPQAELVVLSATHPTQLAAEALRLGACDYVAKPCGGTEIALMLQRVREKLRLLAENQLLRGLVSGESRLQPPGETHLEEIERATIERVFQEVNGDKALAGKLLGISRATLYRKLKRYQIGMRMGQNHTEMQA